MGFVLQLGRLVSLMVPKTWTYLKPGLELPVALSSQTRRAPACIPALFGSELSELSECGGGGDEVEQALVVVAGK